MRTYKLNDGSTRQVPPMLEQKFLEDFKQWSPTLLEDKEEETGPQDQGKINDDATTDANATSTTAASNQEEVVQPQNNQQENTGSTSGESLSVSQEKEFQDWMKNNANVVAWKKQFKKQYGEEPRIDGSNYDYRGAWQAGIVPTPNKEDKGMYHWGSIGIGGKDLKSKDHPTRWKSDFMKATGINPDKSDISEKVEKFRKQNPNNQEKVNTYIQSLIDKEDTSSELPEDEPSGLSTSLSSLGLGFAEFGRNISSIQEGIELGVTELFTPGEMTAEEKQIQMAMIRARRKVSGGLTSTDYKPLIDKLEENIPEYENASITEDLADGNYLQGAKRIVDGALRSAPSLVAAATGVGGLIALGTSSAGGKFEEEFERDPSISTGKLLANAGASGATEATFELMTRGLLKKAGLLKQAGDIEGARKLLQGGAKEIVKNLGISTGGEALSEAGTELGLALIDASDTILGVETGVGLGKELSWDDLKYRLGDAALIGGFVGGTISTVGDVSKTSKAAKDRAEAMLTPDAINNEINSSAEKINKLSEDLVNATEEGKVLINERIQKETSNIITARRKASEVLGNLEGEDLKSYATNLQDLQKVKNVIRDGETDSEKELAKERYNNLTEANNLLLKGAAKKVLDKNIINVEKVSKDVYGEDVEVKRLNADQVKTFIEDNPDLSDETKKSVADEAALSQGFFQAKNKDGKEFVVINEDVASQTHATNVAGHEFLHKVLYKTFEGKPEVQLNVGRALMGELMNKDLEQIASSKLVKRLKQYDTDNVAAEEVVTILSDSLNSGDLQFNENVFTKIGDVVRRALQDLGFRNIQFNTGRDVYNFVKDYNKSIEKGRLKGKLKEVALGKVEGELTTEADVTVEPEIKMSKESSIEASENVQRIYEEQGEAGAFDIIDQFKPIVNKLVEKRREAPNFDKQLLTDEIETGKRGIFDLIREYKPESGVPLAAYINKFLPARAIEASKRVLGEEFTDDVTEAKGVTATDTAEDTMTQESKPKRKGIILADRLNVREQVAPVAEQYVEDNDLTGTTYKKTPNIATETIGELMSIPSKKITSNANLSKPELANAQMFIAKNADMLQSMLPEGATEDGTATGVQKVLLDQFYNKRSKRAKTKAGLATQSKKPNITRTEFLEVFGIVDGKPQRDDRNTSSRVLALAKQLDRAMSNQAIREVLSKDDDSIAIAQKLADGKSKVMFSKSANLDNWPKLVDEISNTDLNEESIINTVDNIYPELKDRNKKPIINQILKDVQEFKDIDASLKGNFTKIVDKEVKDFLLEQFENRQYSQGIKAMLKSVLPKKENGSPVDPGNRAKDISGVQKQRSHLVNQGSKIIDTFGAKKGLEIIISHLGPVYASASKIGDGSITVETLGGKVVLNKDFKGPSQNRQQVTTGMPDFIALLNTIPGVEVESIQGKRGYQAIVDGKTVKLETTLLAEKSEAFLKDRDFNRRKGQAEEARKIVKTMLDNAWSRYKDSKDSFDAADFGLLAMSLGSSMEAPLRRAANAEFIQDGVEAVIARGKKAGIPLKKIVRYEHMKSKEAVISEIIDSYMSTGELNPAVFDGYQVQVISGTLDGLIDKAGYKTKSPQDGSPRAYNEKTLFEAVKIYKDFKDELGPIRSLDPEKAGTDQEYIGKVWNKALEMITGGKDADAKELESLGRARRTYKWSKDMPEKGMSTFDFDETLIIDGENFVVATNPVTGEQVKIKSEEWPIDGPVLAEEGYEFDFSDFANVRGGKEGPLLQKMKNQIKKYGSKNVFVLTARQQDSAEPIHKWLKSQGINIPLENITGLGKSEGEAKGQWMLEKFNEGYNDMYFVDDALPNVKAVKDVLDQLDVKSKVVQAKVKFSKDGGSEFNKMLERNTGVNRDKIFSEAQARLRGKKVDGFILKKFFVPPSAEDFKGLLYNFLGKGKQGETDMAFFKEHLLDPFAKGIRDINFAKQRTSEEFKTLRKEMPDVVKKFNKNATGSDYTVNDAIRVYLWNKNGVDIPGISEQEVSLLSDYVKGDPKIKAFADVLGNISRAKEGYVKPGENWVVGNIASDLFGQSNQTNRAEYLSEWKNNVDVMFSPENINKIEAVYGTDFRGALEDMLYRMETGSNRAHGGDKVVNGFMDWINGSVGAVMFFNTRSAMLQTLSTVNFINWGDNNIFQAAKAFANQPQYWKDFMTLFNSDMLKQRRSGMSIDVNLSELSNTVSKSGAKDKYKAAVGYLLQIGFTPTQIADSFAIASGGATYYRNRINKYLKEGLSQKEAEAQAFEDFQEIAEETQQSSRPDLISQQQAGTLGRLVLAWQNTPMQYTRLTKKAISDLVNGRGDWRSHVSRIVYYGAVQNIIFGSLQTGLAFLLFGGDEDEEKTKTKTTRVANGALDTLLRGTGVYGAMASTLKNTIMKYMDEKDKPYGRRELSKVALEAVQLSPPIGSKLRKIMSAIYSYEYNKGVPEKMGVSVDNPILNVVGNLIEATTNMPLARVVRKAQNVEEAINGNHETWKRVALILGWDKWSLDVKDEELERAKTEVKQEKKEKKAEERKAKKEEQKKADKDAKTKEEEEKKKQGIKEVRCSGTKSNGNRCSIMIETKAKTAKCMYHKTYKPNEGSDNDGDGIKEYQCKSVTGSGKRCKNRTEHRSKKCYAHQ